VNFIGLYPQCFLLGSQYVNRIPKQEQTEANEMLNSKKLTMLQHV